MDFFLLGGGGGGGFRSNTLDFDSVLSQKKAKGQELFDLVFKNLDLIEKKLLWTSVYGHHQVSVS